MKLFRVSLIALFALMTTVCIHAQDMDNEKLEKIIYVVSDTMLGQSGAWEFSVKGLPMICVTDESNNRMRIITPIDELGAISDQQLKEALAANFHSALDVKYAISNDALWVAFIHPLKELTKDQVVDAISQVYYAHLTFGTTYSSTDLVFPSPQQEQKSKKKKLNRS